MTLSNGPRLRDGLAVLSDRLGMVEESLRVLELKLNEASRGRPAPPTQYGLTLDQRDWSMRPLNEATAGLEWCVSGTDPRGEASVVLEAEPV